MTRNTKPAGYRSLLNVDQNAKTVKGQKFGFMTAVLYLAPALISGIINLCVFATEGCKFGCLNTAGRGQFTKTQLVRIAKTLMFVRTRELFLACLRWDIRRFIRRAEKLGLVPVVRVNGTSDRYDLAKQMALEFSHIQFYDYTKMPHPWTRILPNYHLTFSRSEKNESECLAALHHGINVAVVFDTKRHQPLPSTYWGFPVIDGDISDLRFLDPVGVVVGLRAKGKARKDTTSGFVVRTCC